MYITMENIKVVQMQVDVKNCECLRCGHKWIPRKQIVVGCAKCRSPYWNIPRLYPIRKNKIQTIQEVKK